MTITPNSGEFKPKIGLDSLYVALVTADSASAYTAGTPEYLAPAAEASQEPASAMKVDYYDDQPFDISSSEGETKIALKISALPPERQAQITGKTYDASTGRVYDNGGTPPDMALGFRSMKSNGKYRYYWFLKGRFSTPKEEAATKTDSPESKPATLEFTALRTIYKFTDANNDSVKRVFGDEDSTNFSGTGWFTQVQVPGVVAPSALALSSSDPIDGASNVAVDKTITLTFNNALPADSIYNVVVVKADGTAVTCVNTLDTTKKIMTVNPSASLDAASTYIVTYGVTDIYSQTLRGAINFGTA